MIVFFFQAEDRIRGFCPSRWLGDVYKRQDKDLPENVPVESFGEPFVRDFYLLAREDSERDKTLAHIRKIVESFNWA